MQPTSSIEKFPFVSSNLQFNQPIIHSLHALSPQTNVIKLSFGTYSQQIGHSCTLGLYY